MSESCDRASPPNPQPESKADSNEGIPIDVLMAQRSNSRFGFLVNHEYRSSIQGSDGRWYSRENDLFTLVPQPLECGT